MTAQCDFTYLTPTNCPVQCANEAEFTCQGSFFCGSHINLARQSVIDDDEHEVERDINSWERT